MATLQGFEYYLSTGAPVVGAAVDYWPAVLGTPGGAATGSTTTDANGRWTFSPGSAGQFDVRVVLGGRTKWYKGLSATSLQELYVNGALRVHGAALFDTTVGVTGLLSPSGGLTIGGITTFPAQWAAGEIVNAPAWVKLDEQGGAGASYTFASIADGLWEALRISGRVSSSAAVANAGVLMQFSADVGARYNWQETTFKQSATAFAEGIGATSGRIAEAPGSTGGPRHAAFETLIQQSSSPHGSGAYQRPVWMTRFTYEDVNPVTTGHIFTGIGSGSWAAVAATDIASIVLSLSSGSFQSGDYVTLEGRARMNLLT